MVHSDLHRFMIARANHKFGKSGIGREASLEDNFFATLVVDSGEPSVDLESKSVLFQVKGVLRSVMPKGTPTGDLPNLVYTKLGQIQAQGGFSLRSGGLRHIHLAQTGTMSVNDVVPSVSMEVRGNLRVAVSLPSDATLAEWKKDPTGFDFSKLDGVESAIAA